MELVHVHSLMQTQETVWENLIESLYEPDELQARVYKHVSTFKFSKAFLSVCIKLYVNKKEQEVYMHF